MNVFLSFAIVSLLIPATQVFADSGAAYGVFKVVKGDVQIKSGRDGSSSKAQLEVRVYPKDTIVTGKDSRAKILMVDKNELNISPSSTVVIERYQYAPEAHQKDVLLNVISGKLRSKVNQKYDGQTNRFEVKTQSAVAGVRGTDFIVSVSGSETHVVTFQGTVAFSPISSAGGLNNPVFVKPGQTSTVSAGNVSAPQALPKDQIQKMDQESKPEAQAPNSAIKPPTPDGKATAGNNSSGNVGSNDSRGQAPTPTAPIANRDPSSLPPPSPPPMTSMLKPGDLVGGSTNIQAPVPPMLPATPLLPPVPPIPLVNPVATLPPCDFCKQVIQNGATKVNITVTTPGR